MSQPDLFPLPKKPWNVLRLVGQEAPLKPKRIRAGRQQLKTLGRVRDLALPSCALDAKLRAADLVSAPTARTAGAGRGHAVVGQVCGGGVAFRPRRPH